MKKIGLAIMCVDNRLSEPGVWAKQYAALLARLGVDALDVIRTPGPDGMFIDPAKKDDLDAVLRSTKLLVGAHDLQAIAIVAHQQCAGHAVGNEEHLADVRKAAEALRKLLPDFSGEIVPMVQQHLTDDNWLLEEATHERTLAAA